MQFTSKRLFSWLRKNRLFARLDWQLYLLRDLWGSRVWTATKAAMTPHGFKLTTRSHPAYEQMRSGVFEPEETRILIKLLETSDVFIDIGANLGYYCCFALQRHKPVLAFEPQAHNLQCLYQNLSSNGWNAGIEIFPIALSSSPGVLTLFGASGPSASLVRDWAGYSPRFKQEVPANTLDNLLAGRFPGQRLLIKIDVEGAEFQVLRGARQTAGRSPRPAWMMEICFAEYHPEGVNPDYQNIFQFFWDLGYVCYSADGKWSRISPPDVRRWIDAGRRDIGTFNYVFLDSGSGIES
jgi:FkbM family methyltransferase